MSEFSTWWTTGGAGDGAATITRADHSKWAKVLGAGDGITPGYLSELAGSIPALNTFRISSGGAIVDGKPYLNDSSTDINIPSASGGGNTRIDRIVSRANWTDQTVRLFRIAGTDAASPVPPALTQNSGSTWDLPLFQVRVNTTGTVTIDLDERVFRQASTSGILNDAITNEKLRNSAAVSVIGRAANSTGDPADIAAGVNDRLLARVSNALSWVQLTIGMIPDLLITEAKLAAAAAAKLVTNGNSHDHFGGDGAAIPAGGLANGAATPEKSSFFSSQGAAGAIYSGRVASDGNATRLPAGWSSTKLLTGNYRVTHNLGTSNYAAVLSPTGGLLRSLVISSHGTNSFEYLTYDAAGSAVDTSAEFLMIRYS